MDRPGRTELKSSSTSDAPAGSLVTSRGPVTPRVDDNAVITRRRPLRPARRPSAIAPSSRCGAVGTRPEYQHHLTGVVAEFCRESMTEQVLHTCDQNPDPNGCPDKVVSYSQHHRVYGLPHPRRRERLRCSRPLREACARCSLRPVARTRGGMSARSRPDGTSSGDPCMSTPASRADGQSRSDDASTPTLGPSRSTASRSTARTSSSVSRSTSKPVQT
jgi:hypothetical protein